MARLATTADVFNAIGDDGRRAILVSLGRGEASVGELTERLVTVEREGRRFDYALYLLRAGSG